MNGVSVHARKTHMPRSARLMSARSFETFWGGGRHPGMKGEQFNYTLGIRRPPLW
jgi:hypothetical protein